MASTTQIGWRGDCSGAPQKNLCLEVIKEGWVYFLDDDNLVPPNFEETLLKAIKDHPLALAFIFNQTLRDGTPRLRATDWRGQFGTIDCGQFVIKSVAIGPTRFRP